MPRKKTDQKKEIKIKEKIKIAKTKSGLTIPVYSVDGKETGNLELPEDFFNVEVNRRLLAQYVRVYLANRRQGTASTKTRGEVKGSTRKIYRQKGTGRARHGDIKAPIFVGGGVVGGPKPRKFSLKLNKKQAKKALFSALTLKFREKGIFGLSEDFLKIEPKTRLMVRFLNAVGFEKERILVVLPKMQKNNLLLAARNISNISLIGMTSINPYEVLKNGKVLIVEGGLQVLSKQYEN